MRPAIRLRPTIPTAAAARVTRYLCTFLLVLTTFPAFGWQTIKTDEQPPDTLIALQRGACERGCPVYKVIIFADGSVIFDGRHHVPKRGLVRSSISLDALGGLLNQVDSIRFFDMKDRYGYVDGPGSGCDSIKSDAPRVITTVVHKGKAKSVLNHHRCVTADTDQLKQFEQSIDKAVKVSQWLK